MNKIDIDKYGIVILPIDREDILDFNFKEIYTFLLSIKDDSRKYFNKINVTISGYDKDEREIYEIPEIRDYITFLDKCFPYWFYFLYNDLPQKHSPIGTIMLCTCKVQIVKSSRSIKHVQVDPESLLEFMDIHFNFLNEIMEEKGHSIEENKTLSKKILRQFGVS